MEGKSDPKHCLPYALENAESMSNLVIRYSPNGIIVVNASRRIQEINASALKLLGLQNFSVKGFELEAVLPSLQLKQLLEEQSQDVQYFIEEFRDGEVVCECALLPLLEEQSFVIILMDLTSKMKQEERMNQIRKDTIESTQKVIDKQMRVVQEIASLLGETTAETKVVLTKLNKAMGDIHE